jgi:hypothetical protein
MDIVCMKTLQFVVLPYSRSNGGTNWRRAHTGTCIQCTHIKYTPGVGQCMSVYASRTSSTYQHKVIWYASKTSSASQHKVRRQTKAKMVSACAQ